MCGIVGIIGLIKNGTDQGSLLNMADEIRHRGPDGEGYFITNADEFCNSVRSTRKNAVVLSKKHEQNIAFGHRRLSILDLNPSAAQPMCDVSDRYWIVYNGEIYNHAELRKQLEQLGHRFKTDHSDTEVILNAYAQWGRDCLSKFNGMWAFCIWDSLENTIFMARDVAGKKPLYYSEVGSVVYFASELKALLKVDEIPKDIDEKSVYDYLTYAAIPSPDTIFSRVKKLPAAHYLFFKPGQPLVAKRYWNSFENIDYFKGDEKELIDVLREKIVEAVRIRLLADVEVGVLLSGGLDSSINLACASKFTNKPIKSFCVGFENKNGYQNEFSYARKVAHFYKADYRELVLTEKDYFNLMPEMAYHLDEPTSDPASVPLYSISKTAQEAGIRVVLGGEGSDELFVGYQLWEMARRFGHTFDGKPILSDVIGFLHKNSPLKNRRKYYHSWYNKIKKNQPVFWSGTEQRSAAEKSRILSSDFMQKIGNYDSFSAVEDLYKLFKEKGNTNSFTWMTSSDLSYRLPDLLLARLDRMTMAASIEGRNPFLDINLINYAMRIPPQFKTKNNQEKYILKKAFEGILPNEIIYRKKNSFAIPLNSILSNKAHKGECISVIEDFNKATGTFSKEFIKGLHSSNNTDELFSIANLAFWHQQFK